MLQLQGRKLLHFFHWTLGSQVPAWVCYSALLDSLNLQEFKLKLTTYSTDMGSTHSNEAAIARANRVHMYVCMHCASAVGKKGLAILSLETRQSGPCMGLLFCTPSLTSASLQIALDHVLNGLMQVMSIMCLLPFCASCCGNWHLKHSN